jgi:hypothetical protein
VIPRETQRSKKFWGQAPESLSHDELREVIMELQCECQKLDRIVALARRHASPASNQGAHSLAAAIIRICEEK